ncbi:unnamed protein product [Clonostachys rosea f. rosea IK726]|uniref:Uncharacterized protein n=1 Tax=Clonostachys rosea f. rosea IK726 TaxID=1349383 RepID=A0ACA9UB33_BIOOC|nr:unnamed protein product [Clonostachys rosea f. rosea IK726]
MKYVGNMGFQKDLLIMLCEAIPGIKYKLCRRMSGLPKILKALARISLGVAENPLLQHEVGTYIKNSIAATDNDHLGLDDVFSPVIIQQALEGALQKAASNGVKIRAVLISNPHNPLGRCYPAETVREIARFCGSNSLHLISDEIFAKSVYENPRASDARPFTSVISLNLSDLIAPHLVHVAYGAAYSNGYHISHKTHGQKCLKMIIS